MCVSGQKGGLAQGSKNPDHCILKFYLNLFKLTEKSLKLVAPAYNEFFLTPDKS